MRKLLLTLFLLTATPVWACDHYSRLYGAATTLDFCLWETDATDFKTDATITAGEVKVSQSEAAEANCTSGSGACVTDEGSCYSIALEAAEMDTARVYVTIIDTAAKTFLDKCLIVETYGNASAQHTVADVNVTQISGDATAADNLEAFFDDTATTELSACPTGTAAFRDQLKFLYMSARNKYAESGTGASSTGTLYKDNGSDALCTFSNSDNGTAFTRGEGS